MDWAKLATYALTPFPHGWPADEYVFFSPRDPGLHNVVLDIINSASHSIVANHYGFDDDEIAKALFAKANDHHISFVLNLDSTQAAGKHEAALLQSWHKLIGTSVAVGQSVKHAISHLKVTIVDGLYVLSGSTNLSLSGEARQDNVLSLNRNPSLAARYTSILMLNHAEMLKQMAAKKAA